MTQGAASRVRFRSEPPWKHRRTRVMLRTLLGILLLVVGLLGGLVLAAGAPQGAARTPSGAGP